MNTAVEWYNDKLDGIVSMLITNQLSISRFNRLQNTLLEQAKAMEKQQIKDAWDVGKDSFSSMSAEQYYSETFKTDKG